MQTVAAAPSQPRLQAATWRQHGAVAPFRSAASSRRPHTPRLVLHAAAGSSAAAAGWQRRQRVAAPRVVLAAAAPSDKEKMEKFTSINKDYAVLTAAIEVSWVRLNSVGGCGAGRSDSNTRCLLTVLPPTAPTACFFLPLLLPTAHCHRIPLRSWWRACRAPACSWWA